MHFSTFNSHNETFRQEETKILRSKERKKDGIIFFLERSSFSIKFVRLHTVRVNQKIIYVMGKKIPSISHRGSHDHRASSFAEISDLKKKKKW
jgi:hypothetical protein